jgi:hypothetical protein
MYIQFSRAVAETLRRSDKWDIPDNLMWASRRFRVVSGEHYLLTLFPDCRWVITGGLGAVKMSGVALDIPGVFCQAADWLEAEQLIQISAPLLSIKSVDNTAESL